MNRKLTGTLAIAGAAAALTMGTPALHAAAFTSDSTATYSGVTYRAHAYSCNLYVTSCSWDTNVSSSVKKSFTHTTDVKANGIGVSITISADPSATITGNSTSMAHATEKVYGTYNYTAGVARPSIFSVSVASRSRLSTSSGSMVSTGWTTW